METYVCPFETKWLVTGEAGFDKHGNRTFYSNCPSCAKQFERTRAVLKESRECITCHNKRLSTHNRTNDRVYRQWVDMRKRCRNVKDPAFPNYGGRGVVVCPQWEDFVVFLAHMGECPDDYQLDRIDNNGNYEPGNCRWVTAKENMRNRRTTRKLTVNGVTKSAGEWSEETGLCVNVIYQRKKRGDTDELALRLDNEPKLS